jgi:catechol 2,3-dioxygenase-like lactoylglutathione lyase family enzyme
MRLQLAINVSDLDAAIAFYSKMFDATPDKVRPGYANFAIENPPLKFILFEGDDGGTINHLGVEADTVEEVQVADKRLRAEGLEPSGIDETMCCYADKTETWVTAPDSLRWEWYVKQGDNEQFENVSLGAPDADRSPSCC